MSSSLQTLTDRQQRRLDQPLDRAKRAVRDQHERPDDDQRSRRLDAQRQFRRVSCRPWANRRCRSLIASANATSGDQYVFGGINSVAAPIADYFSTPTSAAKTAVDQAFQTDFRRASDRPGGGEHHRIADAELSQRTFAALFSGRLVDLELVFGLERRTRPPRSRPGRPSRPRPTPISPPFSNSPQAYTMLAEFGGSALSATAQQAVASAATALITQGQARLPTRRRRSARRRARLRTPTAR